MLKEEYKLLNELKRLILKYDEEFNDIDLLSLVKKKIIKQNKDID